MPHIKRTFPGGNTSRGFYSFYNYIADPGANKIFVIKGGPGVGKSTFMRKIAEEMVERGYDIELLHCSSDNGSLDGVYIPAIDVALIDGTAPHVVDPKNPGAVDEIIHLGDYWDESGMRANKEHVLRLNREVGRLFRRAYGYLAVAGILQKELEVYYPEAEALDIAGLNDHTRALVADLTVGVKPSGRAPRVRHLFATAITPDGTVNYLETVVGPAKRKYIIRGPRGTGKETMLRRLMEAVVGLGYDVEAYHCALDPDRIEHFLVPELSVAVITGTEPHFYKSKRGDTVINTETFVDKTKIARFQEEIEAAVEAYNRAIQTAVSFINRAKRAHDEMEQFYVPNMDFAAIEERRQRTLRRILDLAKERQQGQPVTAE
ncbi:MAG: PRK06851 family protein [Bacillota bacterium]